METANPFQVQPCKFKSFAPPEVEGILTSVHVERNIVNKYTIQAREISVVNYYEVEAECEEDAIEMVENGDVEPDEREFEEVTDVEVTDVEYGELTYVAGLTCTIHARGFGDKEYDKVKDMVWDLLSGIDGTTESMYDKEVEVVGFNIDSFNEG